MLIWGWAASNTEHLLGHEWACGDVAVLAGEISNLTCLWLGVVTGRDLAANVRIKMSCGGGAVAVSWDRLVVYMVYYAMLMSNEVEGAGIEVVTYRTGQGTRRGGR